MADVGGGPLGHPKVFINLVSSVWNHREGARADPVRAQDKPGESRIVSADGSSQLGASRCRPSTIRCYADSLLYRAESVWILVRSPHSHSVS